MQGVKRRVLFIGLYEGIAVILVSAGLTLVSDHGLLHSGTLGLMLSAVAVAWNIVYNHLFEHWEARQRVRGRGLRRRIAHAIGFEGGLVVLLVPLIAWWLEIGLWEALLMDLGVLVFFLAYTFTFNWVFDKVFGLPRAASA